MFRLIALFLVLITVSGCSGNAAKKVILEVPENVPQRPVKVPPPVLRLIPTTAPELVSSVDARIAVASQDVFTKSGDELDESRVREWSKKVVCWYLDYEELFADGFTFEEAAKIANNELDPNSARKVMTSIEDSVNDIRKAYLESGTPTALLTGVQEGLCSF